MLVPWLALVDLEVLGERAGVPERVVGRGSKQAHVHATRAADLVLAFGGGNRMGRDGNGDKPKMQQGWLNIPPTGPFCLANNGRKQRGGL